DVLALRPDALLLRWMNSGTDRAGGGAWESQLLRLMVFGPDGHVTRVEAFDVDRDAEALARFDELGMSSAEESPPASRVAHIENAATRMRHRFEDAWAARDWEGIAAVFAPDFQLIDRRSHVHLELDRDQELVSLRFRFDMRS